MEPDYKMTMQEAKEEKYLISHRSEQETTMKRQADFIQIFL